MNRLVVILLATASPLLAGIHSAKSPISAKEPISAKAPISDKSPIPSKSPLPPSDPLWSWFVGGSGGYLLDTEEVMWHGHLGIDLTRQVAGFDTSIFLEVGWTQLETRFDIGRTSLKSKLDMIPITLNAKFERQLFGPVNVYAGGGLGVAVLDLDYHNAATAGSDDEVVFYGQLFGGLVLNLTPSIELFAGARWIFLDQPQFDIMGANVDLDDLGGSDSDVLLEAGGRVNF